MDSGIRIIWASVWSDWYIYYWTADDLGIVEYIAEPETFWSDYARCPWPLLIATVPRSILRLAGSIMLLGFDTRCFDEVSINKMHPGSLQEKFNNI